MQLREIADIVKMWELWKNCNLYLYFKLILDFYWIFFPLFYLQDLSEAFIGEAKASDKPRLLLTAAVPASFEAVAAGYDVAEINK